MKTVIKLAGALLEDDAVVRALARQIAALAQQGTKFSSSTAAAAFSPPRSNAWASRATSWPACASPTAKPAMLP